MDVSPVAVDSAGCFVDVDGMLTFAIPRSWFETWFALTRYGALDVVGSFDSFLIVYHAL